MGDTGACHLDQHFGSGNHLSLSPSDGQESSTVPPNEDVQNLMVRLLSPICSASKGRGAASAAEGRAIHCGCQ